MNNLIRLGLTSLLYYDNYLLLHDVNERSITHRLGMYYQSIFPEWDVDCEFNKNLGDPKIIEIDPRKLLNHMADSLAGENIFKQNDRFLQVLRDESISIEDIDLLKSQLRDPRRVKHDKELEIVYFLLTLSNGKKIKKLIYPDIIVHKRGTKHNYVVIEAKKTTNTKEASRAFDLIKLITLVNDREYNYKRGFFIDIPVGADLENHIKFVFKKHLIGRKIYTVASE